MDGHSILLIEDDLSVYEIIEAAFSSADVTVMFARDAETGYRILEEYEPDLILLDLLLPKGKRGWEMIAEIKSVPELAHIPIIVLTAAGSDAIKLALDAGATDYIMKPFTIRELMHKVNVYK